MSDVTVQIGEIRKQLGTKLLILGHHYERMSVLQHADVIGDSLELARKAADNREAERIIFCGVRFMAETADILSAANQTVYMPDTSAGCPMANMASAETMMSAWQFLKSCYSGWLPVVYVNSTAEVKACCGKLGGSACTSSNAKKVLERTFAQGKRVFFLPDQHLGMNTAHDMHISDNDVRVYDLAQKNGGIEEELPANVRIVVWKGFCIVHTAFTVEHVKDARSRYPKAKIIVHPETPADVLRLCDAHGSTSQIIKYVQSAAEGSTIVIGTEVNLIERLARECSGKVTIKALAPSVCANMAKTNENNLLEVLLNWPAGNEIHVAPEIAADARKCLSQMLRL